MKLVLTCLITVILSGCYFSKPKLTGGDIRLWKDTEAWKLAKAVRANDTNKINRILAEGKVSIDYRDSTYGENLLSWAVWNNKIDMVHFLLSKGANPNLHDRFNGESPITLSCKYFSPDAEILRLLLQYGGDPNDHVTHRDTVTYEYSTQTPLYNASSTSLEKLKY